MAECKQGHTYEGRACLPCRSQYQRKYRRGVRVSRQQHVDGSNWSRENLAWAAGLFDGEGCIHQMPTGQIELRLKMADEDVVRRFAAIVGAGVVSQGEHPKKLNHRQMWTWRCSRRIDTMPILYALYEWLGDRRQAKIREVF